MGDPSSKGLLDDEDSEFREFSPARSGKISKRILYGVSTALCFSLAVNIILAVLYSNAQLYRREHLPQSLYSPANEAISYKYVKFDSGVEGGFTPYQGRPTKENNALWDELYAHEQSHITADEARLLPNRTTAELPYPGSGYLIVLNVFHNLHCLDSFRKALYYFVDPAWNITVNPHTLHPNDPDAGLKDFGGHDTNVMHLDHCIDSLRQGVLCESDVTPTVFQWSDKRNDVAPRATVLHQCRDFKAIKEWAKAHRARPFKGFSKHDELGKCGFDDPWTCLYT
ncbi:hypothetical protein FQN49_002898 [Arthroderma sp. PD_2]|nr:hypothetical protein FQN49_002898 [Arthroderma sp. PD_2]